MTMAFKRSISNTPAWTWAFFGAFVGACLSVLVHLPAAWMASGVSLASQGQVQLQEAQGSVWQGHAKLVFTGGEGSRDAMALPGRIHWQLGVSSSANLWPQLQLQLLAACCMTQAATAKLSYQPSSSDPLQSNGSSWRLQVADHESQWPAHLLSGLGAPWNTLQPEGVLKLQTQQLLLSFQNQQTWLQGGITLTAQNMSSKLSTLQPMGTYQVSLGGSAIPSNRPSLTLSTQSGSLLLSGQGQWQGTRLQFRGEASTVPEHAAALSNLLNIIGQRQGARSLLSLG